jgi:hypothetical protein
MPDMHPKPARTSSDGEPKPSNLATEQCSITFAMWVLDGADLDEHRAVELFRFEVFGRDPAQIRHRRRRTRCPPGRP